MPNYPFEYGPTPPRYGAPELFHISYTQEEQVNLTREDAEKVYVALHNWLDKPPLKNVEGICCGTFTGSRLGSGEIHLGHKMGCTCDCHKPLPSIISDEAWERLKEAARKMDTRHLAIEGKRIKELRHTPFRGRSSNSFDWAMWMQK